MANASIASAFKYLSSSCEIKPYRATTRINLELIIFDDQFLDHAMSDAVAVPLALAIQEFGRI